MIYVIDSYEQHFPTDEWSRPRRPMELFWRVVHVCHDLGFIRTSEGGRFSDGRWTWKPWEPEVHDTHFGRFVVCYPLRVRLKMAWFSLCDRVYFP